MRQLSLLLALLPALSCQTPAPELDAQHSVGRFERAAGWIALFDGQTTTGWRGIGRDSFPGEGWDVVDGCLHHAASGGGGDIVTEALFGDFELEFEWKVAPGANSGVKYRVRDQAGDTHAFGPEYQILDNDLHPNGQVAKTSASALYDVIAVEPGVPLEVGHFNHGRIVSRGGRLEHWLNGKRMLVAEVGSESWKDQIANSKFAGRADFASAGAGGIVLQDHGDEVWFRNLRLRELPGPPEREVLLQDGEALDSWREYGDASYAVDQGSILGVVDGGGQSFLISREHYGDFILEVDVKTEEPGNSGIQIRSHEKENGRPFGYQIEIDPSQRAWSGGLYDEARRGWLQNLEDNEAGRAAFAYQEWNHFRIEAIGPWIKVRVNGIPTTDHFDTADLEGFFGLQVHSGQDTRVRWREPRLWDFGVREWEPVAIQGEATPDTWVATPGERLVLSTQAEFPVLKFELRAESSSLHIHLQSRDVSSVFGSASPLEVPCDLGWCIQPALAPTFDPMSWNEVSIGFDATSYALQVNGRTQRRWGETRASDSNFSLINVGEGTAEVRQVMRLGEPRAR